MYERLRKVLKLVGIYELTELQKSSFDSIYSGKNTLIVAPTGSGKTEAAMIPIFQKMLEERNKGIRTIYITPLRALNRDMLRRLKKIAEALEISIDVRHGDTREVERTKQSKKPPEILITTPETFQILFLGKKLRNALRNVRFVVIDEIHELIDNERGVQLFVGIERLKEITKFQIIALSATISDPEKISEIVGCTEVIFGGLDKEYEIKVLKAEDEIEVIKRLVDSHNSTLIFVNTRQTAEVLGLQLKRLIKAEVHHGSLSRDARVSAEERFANGELKALICTSSMELGIDIGHVDAVIQFSSPRQAVRLIQRVGRSGHGLGRKSVGYIIANSFDDILEAVAIVERVRNGQLEKPDFHEKSLDVLANQICAIALEYGRISTEKVYEIVKRCYFYRNMRFEEFDEICRYLAEIWRIFYDGKEISARMRTRKYFYENISMIPDEKSYRVLDVTTGKVIGTLDESFLSTFSGEVFAMKGELWRVLSVEEVVKVEPASLEGEIPSWTGEEIPVPFEVAQDVGRLRETLAKGSDLLICDEKCKEEVFEKIEEHKKEFAIPTDNRVIIEGSDKNVIINVCFGHKANETIGRIIALLLSIKKCSNVSVEIDPYRIKLFPANPEDVKDVIFGVRDVENLAERAVIDTRLMQWKIIKVAKKFGLFGKDEDLNRINLRNLIVKLRGTPIYREALREIFVENLDIEKARFFFEEVGKGISVLVYNKFTPIGISSRDRIPDVLLTKPSEMILKAFRERLMNENCRVQCINCGANYKEIARNLTLRCIRCGSSMIAVVNEKKKEMGREEMFRIANLIASYGMRGVYAMLTYGIGFETAKRILSRFFEKEDDFFKALLDAERNYIRTRKFWD
ncbi:MAG: DEAD/DEAH box helicase [Archaeoglobaceae archaeon]|nr:DEAD/DEAH box helicase [Archaeoglobaceae archaeon]